MRIAVTGGIGFIGQSVISLAQQMGHEVICVDYVAAKLQSYEKARLPILQGSVYRTLSRCIDVIEPGHFIQMLSGRDDRQLPQVIVHLGACVDTRMGTDDSGDGLSLFQNNVEYTRNLTQEASGAGCHVVFASSAAVYGAVPNYGSPCNPYGLTKSIGESLLKQMKTRSVALRFFNVYGKYEHHKGDMASVPFKLARAYEVNSNPMANPWFEMHSPMAKRDFICVDDVALAVMEAADEVMGPRKDMSGQHLTYDVGTGFTLTFSELNKIMMKLFSSQSIVKWVDRPPKLAGRYQDYTLAGNTGNGSNGIRPTRRDSSVSDSIVGVYGDLFDV